MNKIIISNTISHYKLISRCKSGRKSL